MLRQIARLGRRVPFAGERAVAVAVYADRLDQPVRAEQAGYEGVACVDDAARALELYCALWSVTQLPWTLRWCEGLLDFILAMQQPDGRWLNFIRDWDGAPNRDSRTSVAGGAFWQVRALLAIAGASRVLEDERIDVALGKGLPHLLAAGNVPSDVRALHIITALTLATGSGDDGLVAMLPAWGDELVRCRMNDVLMNSPDERGHPHLWGHIQEGVLADLGVHLGREDLVAVARRSADAFFAGVVGSGFDLPRVQPYDVSSAVYALTRLAGVTGAPEYAALAAESRRWFDGRNPAGRAVYDRGAGRIGDGVDGRAVSGNSGAEANIVGAQALFDDTVTLARSLAESEALPQSLC